MKPPQANPFLAPPRHTVPGSRGAEAVGKDQRWYEEALADAYPVIIYLHGNGGTRAASHRVQFLKTMGAADFHILALDYRGYGDSSGHPTESGFTTDVLALYDWAKARSGNSSILFWGHSLGTGWVRGGIPHGCRLMPDPTAGPRAVTLLPDRCHAGMDQGLGAAPWWRHLQSQTQQARGGLRGALHPAGASWLLPLTVTSLIAGLPRMRQGNFRKREVRASMAGLAPRGVPLLGALHIPGRILGATSELGSPVTLRSSIRLGPRGGDEWLSPSSLADGGTLPCGRCLGWERGSGPGVRTTPP
uniref:Abhydrolase domain containing 12B n=1 Tax=Buteo japonicus TaxID=224669 RepID=A0A8B9Z5Z1_9AVES